MKKKNIQAVADAISHAGSKQLLAQMVGVSYKTVLDWASGRSGISIPNALKIEKITNGKVKAKDLINFPWDDLS